MIRNGTPLANGLSHGSFQTHDADECVLLVSRAEDPSKASRPLLAKAWSLFCSLQDRRLRYCRTHGSWKDKRIKKITKQAEEARPICSSIVETQDMVLQRIDRLI